MPSASGCTPRHRGRPKESPRTWGSGGFSRRDMPHNAERGARPRHLLTGGRHQGDGLGPTGDRFERSSWRQSVPPEVFEPRLTQCRVARGVGDRYMPEPVPDRPGLDAVIGELVAATIPQHVEVHRRRRAGALARSPGWHAERRTAMSTALWASRRSRHADGVPADRFNSRLQIGSQQAVPPLQAIDHRPHIVASLHDVMVRQHD